MSVRLPFDVLSVVSGNLKTPDVANLSMAVREQALIRDRKRDVYKDLFDARMRSFWMGRFLCFVRVFRTSFWKQHGDLYAISYEQKNQMCRSFLGWTVEVCGSTLYASTRVIDDIISATVELRSPVLSLRGGDIIRFAFDITRTSVPLDIDAYAPVSGCAMVLTAMYEALKLKSQQFMAYGDSTWTNFVTIEEMVAVFEQHLLSVWFKDVYGIYTYCPFRGVIVRTNFMGAIFISTDIFSVVGCRIHICPFGLCYSGWETSSKDRSGCVSRLTRSFILALEQFDAFSPIHVVRSFMRWNIRIKIGGEFHTFASWHELSCVSGISERKLRQMASKDDTCAYIDFDSSTYKKKPISFMIEFIEPMCLNIYRES